MLYVMFFLTMQWFTHVYVIYEKLETSMQHMPLYIGCTSCKFTYLEKLEKQTCLT